MCRRIILSGVVILLTLCFFNCKKNEVVISLKDTSEIYSIYRGAVALNKKKATKTSLEDLVIIEKSMKYLFKDLKENKAKIRPFMNNNLPENETYIDTILYLFITKLLSSGYTVDIIINNNTDGKQVLMLRIQCENRSVLYTDIPVINTAFWSDAEEIHQQLNFY